MSWFRRPRPLRFLYSPTTVSSGTTVMRGFQLASIARESGLRAGDISCEPINSGFRSTDLFLTKGAARSVDPEQIMQWRRRGNRVFLDPVDEDVSDEVAAVADGVIAASFSARDDFASRWPGARIALVHHHVDPRLRRLLSTSASPTSDQLVARYFGELVNTVVTARVSEFVQFVQVDTSRQDDAWLRAVPGANLHYAVRRRRGLDRNKPFLKGFTAALAGANILIDRGEAEAAHWLPEDYPYWAQGGDEEQILTTLGHARESFGGREWARGMACMRDIAARTTDALISRQLVDAVA